MASLYIGRDYLATVSGVELEGTLLTSGTVAWALYAGDTVLGSGSGSYAGSAGEFTCTIPASTFVGRAPATNTYSQPGRLYVTIVKDGVSGSWGETVAFAWPTSTAG